MRCVFGGKRIRNDSGGNRYIIQDKSYYSEDF